jgi:ubiquinone biosynthesis protein
LRDAATDLNRAAERLPAVLRDAEDTLAMLADGGLRIHPDSLRALAEAGRRPGSSWPYAMWAAVALLAIIAGALLS